MKNLLRLCIAILLVLPLHLCAQIFSGTPSGIRWKQIKTDTARIIYPKGEDSLAQRVAALVHYQQRQKSQTLGSQVHPINIVLRNELTYFNGYVGLGPYRSEYYVTPPQDAFDLGALSATDLLSVHEYRHVEQYNNFRKGLAKVAYVLFGQNGQALANDAAIPNWFFEGDAVYNETLLSQQGRGRLPDFFNGYKSLYYDGKDYNYMKLRNGSFKHFVPNHYPLGYLLVAYGREQYGADFWNKVTDRAARFKPLLYPMQGSLKQASGVPYRQFVSNAFSFYQQQWHTQKQDNVSWVTAEPKRNVVNYRFPYRDDQNGLIVLKQSYQTLPRYYHVDEHGNETHISQQRLTNDNYFSYNNGKIVYASYQPSTRWGYREYSIIKMLDIHTKRERKLSSHSRYFSPDISHDGKLIAAVSITPQQHSAIDILRVNGFKINSLANRNNEIYSYPKFSADDNTLYFIARKQSGEMSLQQWNLSSQTTTVLLPFANRIIGFPVVQGDTLLYSCSNEGKDEIWAYVAAEKKHYRMVSYQTGLYGAVLTTAKQVVASAFTSSGYRLGTFAAEWKPVDLASDTLKGLYVKQPFGRDANETLDRVPQSYGLPAKSYAKISHPFNFHSLQPDYSNPIFSLTLYGENVLSTIQNQVYYNYNRNERYSQVGYNLTYGVTFLQPFVDVSTIIDRKIYDRQRNVITYNELTGIAGVQLPLNLSGGREYRSLIMSLAYGFDNTMFTGEAKQFADNFTNGYVQSQVRFISQKQAAYRHIYPHWAQSVFAQYRHLTGSNNAAQLLVRGSVYLPGLLPSHSIVVEGAYEQQRFQNSNNLFNYTLSDNFPYSRGYSSYNYPTMYKAGINYHLPLVYPDFGVGNIVYLRRIRANAFFDLTNIRGTVNNQYFNNDLKSAGGEIYFDTKWWNQQSITFGIRYSRLLDYKITGDQPNQWTLILPSSIFQ